MLVAYLALSDLGKVGRKALAYQEDTDVYPPMS